jgi:probable F420-dependent oxidoreductase
MGTRPIRFGVIADAAKTTDDLIALGQWAEDIGYSTLLLRDHVVEEPFGNQLGPLVAMATVALSTTTLRIGTLVVSNDFRSPVQLAKEVATLDMLSNGRVELGLGAGFLAAEYAPLGIPFDPPAVRVSRLEESLQALKRLFTGDPVTYRGRHVCLEEFTSFPASVQRPHPPILVAGSGDRMLRMAAREADIVGIQTVNTTSGDVVMDPANWLADTVQGKVKVVRDAAGARFDTLELSTTVSLVVTDDREAGARQVIAEREWHDASIEDVLEMPALLIGSHDEIAHQIRERRDRFGPSYLVVSQKNAELAAPLVRELTGQ